MSHHSAFRLLLRNTSLRSLKPSQSGITFQYQNVRTLHIDGRNRLSTFWAPTQGTAGSGSEDDSHTLLLRSGFLRQAHSGVFHLLPLGQRVQNKLERLIDKHMTGLGASKVSLSSITTRDLWLKSGRYSANSEFLRVRDRKESGFFLSPTHEEEITTLVGRILSSYKDLPLRLYQISRKYRDEKRPREGLLRAKEFLMKDLYTFDSEHEAALSTYRDVCNAYVSILDELKIPYLVAEAESGDMGGKLSHEYHFSSLKGEDNVCVCNSCNYVANEEKGQKSLDQQRVRDGSNSPNELIWEGITTDRRTLVEVHYPHQLNQELFPTIQRDPLSKGDLGKAQDLNIRLLKEILPELDTSIETGAFGLWASQFKKVAWQQQRATDVSFGDRIAIYDYRLLPVLPFNPSGPSPADQIITTHPTTNSPLDLTRIRTGDLCPRCLTGTLTVHKAIEVGHTFHLGTRYSVPLKCVVETPTGPTPVHMGCHGIGVSRLIGAIAAVLADGKGLNWPRVVAPFEAVVFSGRDIKDKDTESVYDGLLGTVADVVLDDRKKELGWKLIDADLVGYPVIVLLGRRWKEEKIVELQCRRLGVKEDIVISELAGRIRDLLEQL
ncbi:prolyl-tRNA synthetase [Patellaria atrata CBS 101060]|uniref:proline--tRNA ligase n=1 Tax=Patellaria atrata CBS 101060 TaxID=1346257 RepID=A0A9P4SGB4_9PEZI|nr:prolyl-tRNA synthetase [Patellaria atrata CBS 101060]